MSINTKKTIIGLVVLLLAAFTLGSCGSDSDTSAGTDTSTSGGGSSGGGSSGGGSSGGGSSGGGSEPSGNSNIPPAQSGDVCVINNVKLNPSGDATFSEGDRLIVTIDYTLAADVAGRVEFSGTLLSADENDRVWAHTTAQFTGPGAAGRYINQFHYDFKPGNENYTDDAPDHYTTLEITHYPSSGCDLDYPVNYIIVK